MEKIKIINSPTNENPFLVISKPSGLPSAPLTLDDKNNALSQAIELFPEIKSINGRKPIEYGLIHRLDTVTEGLILIATSQESYEYLLNLQNNHKLIKTYSAICNFNELNSSILGNFPPFSSVDINNKNEFQIRSFFRHFGPGKKEVRPVTIESGEAALKKIGKQVEYTTNIKISECNNIEKIQVICCISSGFKHQVRCHLAWIGLPIIGDSLYNATKSSETIKFKASKIEFDNRIYEI